MARIRSIKPEFFTSEDIVSLTPLARLFYVSLWCEADREGRLSWNARTLKFRYFPADDCSIEELSEELIELELIALYEVDGKIYCVIPGFKRHQVINNKEAESTLPEPPESRVKDASLRVLGEGRKEGKGREGKGTEKREDAQPQKRGSRLSPDWTPPDGLMAWAAIERSDLDLRVETERFRDYWTAKPGKDGVKLDWDATFRNWIRSAKKLPSAGPLGPSGGRNETSGTGRKLSLGERATLARQQLEAPAEREIDGELVGANESHLRPQVG